MVSAWAEEQRLVLGQKKADEKTAIPELLEELDLQGALVSIDAIACSKKTAEIIIRKQGDYLLSLKKNQKELFEQVSEYMIKQKENRCLE